MSDPKPTLPYATARRPARRSRAWVVSAIRLVGIGLALLVLGLIALMLMRN